MATRRFTYISADGFVAEQASGDDIALGGLSMSGAIAMGTNKVTGLADASSSGDALGYGQSSASLAGLTLTADLAMSNQNITGLAAPSGDGDATRKSYVDQLVISGGTLKEALLHEDQIDNTEGVLAAVALTMANNPVSGDLVTFDDGVTTRSYGAAAGGDVQYAIGGSPAITMQNLATAIAGDGSAITGADFTTDLDAIDTDGVIVITELDNNAGAMKIFGVWGTQADADIVDFGGEADYTSKTLTDMPATEPGSTNFGIRRDVAALTDGEMHYVINNDVIYGWDDSANEWNAMSGSASIPDATASSGGGTKGKITVDSDLGLDVSSGILSVDLASDPGLEFSSGDLRAKVDTTAGIERTSSGIGIDLAASNPALGFDGSGDLQALADATAGMEKTASGVAIDLGATNPGLEFDGSGDLQAKVSGSAGIITDANGIAIEIDDTPDTLDVDGDGLKVVGLPSLFKVNDVAVGATVTAANCDTLTDGSNADALHIHAGVEEAKALENSYTATEALTKADPVYFDATNDQVAKGQAGTDAKAWIVGVAKANIAQDAAGDVVSYGPAPVLVGATAGVKYYLDDTGGLKSGSPPAGAKRVILVGWAVNATTLWVQPIDFGKKAA